MNKKDKEVLEQIKNVNGPLKNAISQYYESQTAKRATNALVQMVNAHLLVPAVLNDAIPGNGTSVTFSIVPDQEGKSFFLAFTDEEDFVKWSKEAFENQKYVVMDFMNLVAAIEQNPTIAGYVINGKSQPFMVQRHMLLQMRQRLQDAMKKA